MTTAKEEVQRLLESLPDDVSYEDIQYQIHVRQRISEGLNAIDEGRVLSEAEVERRMDRWLGQ